MNEDAISRADALRVVQEARERGIVDLREILAELRTLPAAPSDEYTAFLEAGAAKAKAGRCLNCNAALRPLHCCICEGCDGCREHMASASDAEQLSELRRVTEKALNLKWLRNLGLNHRSGCAAITLYDEQCSCGLKDYLVIDDELRAALNPKQPEKETQGK